MKKHYLLLSATIMGAVSLGMVGCADDDTFNGVDAPADNAIRFAANTEYSRAGDITTNNLTSFNVYAYTDSSSITNTFMENVEVTKTGTNTWTYSPVKYWPAKEAVDFYAFAPASWVGTSGPLKPVAYESYPGIFGKL